MGISDLVKKWPASDTRHGDTRREVLLISSGIDPWSPVDPQNPYLLQAINDAQRAGILVHSIYYAEAGRLGRNSWSVNWGENYLSELGEATGGEAYWQGLHSPVSFAPYLRDLARRLQSQYLVTLIPQDKRSGLTPVRVTTSEPGVSLMAASRMNVQTGQ